jgi:hypothetical protein
MSNYDQPTEEERRLLNEELDKAMAIAKVEVLLRQHYDRRGKVRQHEPEQRGGFDRRAMVAPINP